MSDLAGILLLGIILILGGLSIIADGGIWKTIFIDMGVFANPIGFLCITFGVILVVYYFKQKLGTH